MSSTHRGSGIPRRLGRTTPQAFLARKIIERGIDGKLSRHRGAFGSGDPLRKHLRGQCVVQSFPRLHDVLEGFRGVDTQQARGGLAISRGFGGQIEVLGRWVIQQRAVAYVKGASSERAHDSRRHGARNRHRQLGESKELVGDLHGRGYIVVIELMILFHVPWKARVPHTLHDDAAVPEQIQDALAPQGR